MLTVTIDINDDPIRRLTAVRTDETETHDACCDDEDEITLTRYEVRDENVETGETRESEVWHDREAGATELTSVLIYDAIHDDHVTDVTDDDE